MRGWVCNLLVQLLLLLARSVTLGPKSRRTHDPVLLPHMGLPQPGGPGPRIYIPQKQGGPVITPCTELPFCRLSRPAGLRWRYSNPSPHGNHFCITELLDCEIQICVCVCVCVCVCMEGRGLTIRRILFRQHINVQ
jgi:hypothetical protein